MTSLATGLYHGLLVNVFLIWPAALMVVANVGVM